MHSLQIEPELRRRAQRSARTPGGVRGDGTAALDNIVDGPRRHDSPPRRAVPADSEFVEKLGRIFDGMN